MIWAAAFPGAALRVMRMAAGRYALHVAVLVGGLFALGLLWGEQAHAVDGVPSAPTEHVRSATTDAVGEATRALTGTQTPTGAAAKPVVRSVGAQVARVTRPVGDVAEKVTEGLADAKAKLPPSASLPSVPNLPGVPHLPAAPSLPAFPDAPGWSESPSWPDAPSWPGLPTPPGVPEFPGAPEVPGLPGIPGKTLPAPVTSAPQPGGAVTSPGAKGEDSEGRSAVEASPVHGPRFTDGGAVSGGAGSAAAHRVAAVEHAPMEQSPGAPGGALVGKPAMDSGTSRHGGDAHAVTFDHRAPLWLVPGAAVGVDADGTRNRHQDIPVSPA
ncbi:hypothetical protein [Streptomyces lincolnensis]|uniref:hypothetical protein n=1 Tax=Streptomyces lincolnensis TaxID=1915 RepID=UPI0037CE5981